MTVNSSDAPKKTTSVQASVLRFSAGASGHRVEDDLEALDLRLVGAAGVGGAPARVLHGVLARTHGVLRFPEGDGEGLAAVAVGHERHALEAVELLELGNVLALEPVRGLVDLARVHLQRGHACVHSSSSVAVRRPYSSRGVHGNRPTSLDRRDAAGPPGSPAARLRRGGRAGLARAAPLRAALAA